MFIILPKDKKDGFAKLEKNLTGESLLKMIRATSRQKVDVRFGKFFLRNFRADRFFKRRSFL